MAELRQRLMILYQYTSDLASRVGAWSIYDGVGAREHCSGDAEQPPYASALAAMQDGWRVIQMPQQSNDERIHLLNPSIGNSC